MTMITRLIFMVATSSCINGVFAQGTNLDFHKDVEPLLSKYCHQCHGPDTQESDVRIDILNPNMVDGQHGGKWRELLDAIDRGDMPPDDVPQPTDQERERLSEWISSELDRAARALRSTGGRVTIRRLTNYEYNNTMKDLLGVDLDFSKELPPDTKGIDGYKNNGYYLGFSSLQLEAYYAAAKKGLNAAIVQGSAPKKSSRKITESDTAKFDRHTLARFNEKLNGSVVDYIQIKSKRQAADERRLKRMEKAALKAKKEDAANLQELKEALEKEKAKLAAKIYTPTFRHDAMLFLYEHEATPRGSFLLRIEASSTKGDSAYSPPRMMVRVGTKSGVGLEPHKILGQVDARTQAGEAQIYEFKGNFEDFPSHEPGIKPKFPGLRFYVTDRNAVLPQVSRENKAAAFNVLELDKNRPQLVIHSMELISPIDQTWPPKSHRSIFPAQKEDEASSDYVRRVLATFMGRAYRRPATSDEISRAFAYYEKISPTLDTFEDRMQEVLAFVLTSPHFLYLPEYHAKDGDSQKVALNDFELASRLSYLFWGSMPDRELMALAQQRKLNANNVLGVQVERLLADKRSWNFVESFAGQWLDVEGVDGVAVNPEYFPDFDESLKEDMKKESLHFFAEVLYDKLSCLNFIDSDFVMLNDRLADFYEIEKPKSGDFVKVKLQPDSIRGGVLTQASFLLGNSNGAESNPIYRATWFRDRILGDPAGDPPADVPEIDEESPENKKLTLKQQLEKHRQQTSCNRCHKSLDPWGIPLERFNAVGQFTGMVRAGKKGESHTIEDDTTLPGGTKVAGSRQFRSYLLTHQKDKFSEGFCKHVLTYALGRSLEWTDQPLVDQLSSNFQKTGYRMDRLLLDVVQSDAFRYK